MFVNGLSVSPFSSVETTESSALNYVLVISKRSFCYFFKTFYFKFYFKVLGSNPYHFLISFLLQKKLNLDRKNISLISFLIQKIDWQQTSASCSLILKFPFSLRASLINTYDNFWCVTSDFYFILTFIFFYFYLLHVAAVCCHPINRHLLAFLFSFLLLHLYTISVIKRDRNLTINRNETIDLALFYFIF